MHNDEYIRGVRLVLTIVGLLSGVVCGAAGIGSAMEKGVVLPSQKPDLILETSDRSRAATETSTSETSNSLPEDKVAESKLSAGYHLVSKAVREQLRQGRPTYALKFMGRDPLAQKLKHSEFDRIKAQIAQSYLIEGKIERATEVSAEVVKRSGKLVPLGGWVAGQAAWRNGQFDKAGEMFALTARSKQASDWLASGAAYWAARSYTRMGRTADATKWHEKAAKYPNTFYGLIALKAMGRRYDFNRDVPSLDGDIEDRLDGSPAIQEILRLARSGKMSAAINGLAQSGWMSSPEKRQQMLAYVLEKKVPSLVLYMARMTKSDDGRFYDLALYPESPWEPHSGYMIDKAIVHALIRQESRFNPHATSSLGATGLMQLLPSTARYVARNDSVTLTDPETNLEIGQKYVSQLMRDPVVNNDLFKMAVAYNAGPGNLTRWQNQLKDVDDDPLLFIESIPSGETRAFVERVMLNYWIYRMRMGQDTPSLDVVASLDRPSVIEVAQSMSTGLVALASGR